MRPWSNLRSNFDDFWQRQSEGERRGWRFLAGTALLALLAPVGYLTLKPAWDHWRHRQAFAQAARFADEKDYRNMLLALQRATQIEPADVTTWRRVAEALDALGLSDTLLARENIVQLAPDDIGARLELATAALRFARPEVGREALQALGHTAIRQADFHRLSAELARALGDGPALEQHLVALLALEPENPEARLNLALLRLHRTDSVQQQTALATLESLTTQPRVRLRASLQLLDHAARLYSPERAGAVVRLLLARLPAPPASRADATEWNRLLAALKTTAAQGTPTDVALTARWLASVRLGAEAAAWIDPLPAALRDQPAVRDVTAELAARAGDLARLRPLLEAGAWGPVPVDAVTLALASHLQALRGAEERGRETWSDALAAAQDSPGALAVLTRLAQTWHENRHAEAALQTLIKAQPRAFWAYAALRSSYEARGDSAQLLSLYETWQEYQPADSAVAARWIQLGCVLDRVSPKMEARAAALFAASPTAPGVLPARAALLWHRHACREARDLLTRLPAEDRARPAPAFWLTLIHADLGDRSAANATAAQITLGDLLPEEVALLHKATRTGAAAPLSSKNAPTPQDSPATAQGSN